MDNEFGGSITNSPQSTPGNSRKAVLKGHRGPKSKTGCTTCKARRIKCDEEKPSCQQCIRKGVECVYLPAKTSRESSDHLSALALKTHSTSSSPTPAAFPYAISSPPYMIPQRIESSQFPPSTLETAQPSLHNVPRSTFDTFSGQHEDFESAHSLMKAAGSRCLNTLDDEEKMLTETFFGTTTHLFSIYTGLCNPFMRLRQYLPKSRALGLAVQAMAALTISGHQSEDKTKHMDRGLELQRMAYQEISQTMEDRVLVHSDAFFAAIVHIGMTEPWHTLRSGESGAMHLKTSKFLISQRIQHGIPLPPKYLCNLLLYWDMLVSLHSDSAQEGYRTEMLFNNVHSEEEPIDYIDPTLGVGVHLFPIIVEMEHFLRFIHSQEALGNAIDPHHHDVALAIERKLKAWQPEIDPICVLGCTEVFKTSSLQDIIFTAEAYRQAALLLLYRTLPSITVDHRVVDGKALSQIAFLRAKASLVLQLLMPISITAPVCTTHEWLLFIAASDIITYTERAFIIDRLNGLLDKIGVVGIQEVLSYIEEVWKLIDSGAPTNIWYQLMHERQWFPLLG